MSLLAWILVFSLLGGVLSVLAAALFLLIPRHRHPHVLPYGISFAIGALLTAAFGNLLPAALAQVGSERAEPILLSVLFGILGFFLLEKLLIWRHCHSHDCEAHSHSPNDSHGHAPAGTLIVFGDAIHNFVDGALVAAAFMTDIQLGVVTSLAVAAHEIPQEVGDFAILLQSGFSRTRAFVLNLLSSLGTVLGAIIAYCALGQVREWLPYFLAVAAASFIYVAVADLIPALHRRTEPGAAIRQIVVIAAGVILIIGAHHWVQRYERHSPTVSNALDER